MAFIERVVGPDEKLIGVLSVHWIYAVKGLMWMTGFVLLGLFVDTQIDNFIFGEERYAGIVGLQIISNYAFWTSSLIGFMLLVFYVTMMLTTELGLTTKRIIYKKGLLAVDVKESDLEEIKAADVDNGILGRIFNYGYIIFDARFVANVTLPAINDPYRFLKAMNEARSVLQEESLTIRTVEDPTSDLVHVNDIETKHKTEEKKSPHDMSDSRYQGTEKDPMVAAANMLDDTIQETKRSVKKIKKDAKTVSSTNFKKARKEAGEKIDKAGEDIKDDLSETAEAVQNPSPEEKSPQEPTVFKPDLKQRKKNLRAKIKRSFSRKSDAPDA